MKKSTLIIFILVLASCRPVEKSSSIITPFFDTRLFLDAEFPSSDLKMKSVQKKISYNGVVETTNIDSYDISEDLELLKSANVNNPSWSDKYQVDSIQISKNRMEVIYSTLDRKMKIKSLKTDIEHGRVIGFEAKMERDALISTSKKTISYQSKEGYKLSTDSKGLATENRSIIVEVIFNPS